MKKTFKLMLAAVMLLTATSASAQFSRKENSREPDRFHMGLRAGFTVNSQSYERGENQALLMPYGGIALDFQLAPIPLFLETGVYYMDKGYNRDFWTSGGSWYYDEDKTEQEDDHYIHMPILVSYHINVAPNLFVQPFLGYVGGYLTESEEFDGAVRIGCGLNFGRLYFNMGYDIGLVEHENGISRAGSTIHWGKENKWSNNTFFMTLGFNWAGSR